MFTAMISRYHVLIALPALAVALGVGWLSFELGRGRFGGTAEDFTGAPGAEQTAGEAPGSGAQAPPASGLEPGLEPDQDATAAGSIDRPDSRQANLPDAEAARVEPRPQPPGVGAEQQRGAPSAPKEPERTTAEPAAPTIAPPAVPRPQPSGSSGIAGSPASEQEPAGGALAVDRGAGKEDASPDQRTGTAPATEARAGIGTEPQGARRAPGTAPLQEVGKRPQPDQAAAQQPPVAAPSEAIDRPPEPNEPTARPDDEDALALAAPREPAARPAPSWSVAPSPPDRQAATDEPAVQEREPAPEVGRPADERSAAARAAETLKRALATLFGGATDEDVPSTSGEAEVAAVPDDAPATGAGQSDELAPGAAPSFDIVRIQRDGQAVIAGRAPAGAEVEIRSGDRTIDRVRADHRGEWVAVPPEPLSGGVQELTLAARVENRPVVDSAEVLVIAVPDPPPPEIALRAPDIPTSQPARVAAGPGEEAFAVALPRDGAGGGRILQAPGRISGEGALALVMLDYDDAGRIRLSGEASAGAALRIYVDNQPAGAAVAGPSGRWEAVLEQTLTPGNYTLRLDQLGASGKPDARIETPFTRVSQPPVAGDVQVDRVIVQPGNSLWRIARRVLGEGMHYVHIYQANQAQIRDPDLIHPGQVFEVPKAARTAG
jgi:nucleoid-associated protein YgaU